MYRGFGRSIFYAAAGKVLRQGSFCPVFGGKIGKSVPNSQERPELVSLRRGLGAWAGRDHAMPGEGIVSGGPPAFGMEPLHAAE